LSVFTSPASEKRSTWGCVHEFVRPAAVTPPVFVQALKRIAAATHVAAEKKRTLIFT
jgi:hypothetical protein